MANSRKQGSAINACRLSQQAASLGTLAAGFVLATLAAPATQAVAGGGPENVLLVVNELDDDSKTIANHYIRWRNIPAQNVLYIKWRGSQYNCTGERFRDELLVPILRTINERKLSLQVDYIVYSAGFPWRVDLTEDFAGQQFSQASRPVASLTGATYLWQMVLAKSPAVVSLATNWYVPRAPGNNYLRCASVAGTPTRGFRGRYGWRKGGIATSLRGEDSQRYFLSAVLGVTEGRGNTVDEVLRYLKLSVAADRTQPNGTFYFVKTDDIRSTPRDACYAGVAQALVAEGATARVLSGGAPRNARDMMGLMIGARECDLAAAGSTVLPGAICEHLTSFGGDLRSKGHQMPLSEFLRQGAAGASGTITEPQAIQAKFPLPSLHLHYRRGCSLAEAFYQSVAGPYQLLVVGDPLCQPWARPPGLKIDGLAAQPRASEQEPEQKISGTLEFTPHVNPGQLTATRPCEVFLDGRLYAPGHSGKPLRLDTTKLAEGRHEVRVVAISTDKIEAQFAAVCPFTVNNQPDFAFTLAPAKTIVGLDEFVELTATVTGELKRPISPSVEGGSPAEGEVAAAGNDAIVADAPAEPDSQAAPQIVFRLNSKVLQKATLAVGAAPEGDQPRTARLRTPAKSLGRGPARLTAELLTGGASSGPRTAPVWLEIE